MAFMLFCTDAYFLINIAAIVPRYSVLERNVACKRMEEAHSLMQRILKKSQ